MRQRDTYVLFLILVWGWAGAAALAASWPNQCGDGRVDRIIDDFEDPTAWVFCCSDGAVPPPAPTLEKADGCSGDSLAIDFDLTGGDWIIILRDFDEPLDLSQYTHLRFALRSSNPDTHHNLEIKLLDSKGLYTRALKSTTDLPVWRPIYLDFRELICDTCLNQPIDLSAIQRIEIGIARCNVDCEPVRPPDFVPTSSDRAVLYLDELAAVDLRPGAKNRLVQTRFEPVVAVPDMRAATAGVIREKMDENDLVPAWFDEEHPDYPQYNTYTEALSLLVFVEEYERTGDPAYRDAASRLAARLLSLQIEDGVNAGAWYTSYKVDNGQIVPADSSTWVGNTSWAIIALVRLESADFDEDPDQLESSIASAASWLVELRGTGKEYLVTEGLEGNISAYFALRAAGRDTAAAELGASIYKYGWDKEQRRMKIGSGPSDYATALDVAGSWGIQFLRALGNGEDALSSLSYAATVLRTASFDTQVEGYGDIAGPWAPTVEFGAQGAAAGILDANYIMEQIYSLQRPDGSFPGSTDDWFGGGVTPWNTTLSGVAPTAWVYFAQNGDPLLDLCCSETLYFAQFGNGGGLVSDLVLIDPSLTETVSGSARFFDDNGLPLEVGVLLPEEGGAVPISEVTSGVEFSIPPRGTLTISTDGQGGAVAGAAVVTSDHRLGGVIRFGISGRGIAGVQSSSPLRGFTTPVRRTPGGINTGIALHNTEDESVKVNLCLRDSQGQKRSNACAEVMLPPHGHRARFIDDLFPEADTENFQGTLEGGATGGRIAATALELGTRAGEFTALPVTPLDSAFRDLDEDGAAWGVFTEGSPDPVLENVSAPSLVGQALRCGLAGGAPFSNVHCYRNLPPDSSASFFSLSLSFLYRPETSFNNQGNPSVVQAVEFTVSKWHRFTRYEFALQWMNVGEGGPQWRYWDASQVASERWVPLNIPDELAAERWHALTLEGEIVDEQVHYLGFTVNGRRNPLGITVPPAPAPGEESRLAVAVQVDGSAEASPYDVFLDQVELVASAAHMAVTTLPGRAGAGIEASRPLAGFVAPVRRALGSVNTRIGISNSATLAAGLDLSLWNRWGEEIPKATLHIASLPAGGHVTGFIDELFPEASTDDFHGTLLVEVKGGEVTATALEVGSTPGHFTNIPMIPLEEGDRRQRNRK